MTQVSHIALGIIISILLDKIWLDRYTRLSKEESDESVRFIRRFFE